MTLKIAISTRTNVIFSLLKKMFLLDKKINSDDLETISNSYKNILNDCNKDDLNINLIILFETEMKCLF